MLLKFNSAERTASDWETLFKTADPRFVLLGIGCPEGSTMSILEFGWDIEPHELAGTSAAMAMSMHGLMT